MRAVVAARRFLSALPALVFALTLLRLAELVEALPPGGADGGAISQGARAFAEDLLALGRHLPLLFLAAWPALALPSPRARAAALGLSWSLLVAVQAALVMYFLNTRVVLGADLFSYSWSEIRTSSAGAQVDLPVLFAGVAALAVLWVTLRRQLEADEHAPSSRSAVVVLALTTALSAWAPREWPALGRETEYAHSLRLAKLAVFVDNNADAVIERRVRPGGTSVAMAAGAGTLPAATRDPAGSSSRDPIAGPRYLDPRFPFLHTEQTPDVLGPRLQATGGGPPNLVFVIVEGLGRSFSGPGAELGSFTPFLDELSERSLYFENFLSAQGRTFAVLSSVFGSLPFGSEGFLALGARAPEHATLLGVLKGQGYRTRFYCGFDSDFDGEGAFLQRQGVDEIHGRAGFGAAVPRVSVWGYDDNELVSFALAREAKPLAQPFVDIIQTVTMHDPYRFLGQERYAARFEQHLVRLGLAEEQKARYRDQRAIFASVLYTDDALRRYFDEARKQPWFARTVFVITGDHRLPEIPMGEWIDRYHVPLIVYSPLLKEPQRISSVSSQLDLAPTLLAYLAGQYGLRSPGAVTWLGTGLDLDPGFRNVHEVPLKQTKPTLDAFVQGRWALSRGELFRLDDRLHAEPVQDAALLEALQGRLAAFKAANASIEQPGGLMPPGASTPKQWVAYDPAGRAAVVAAFARSDATGPALGIREVQMPGRAREGALAIDVVMSNSGSAGAPIAAPLAVLQTADGLELSESYGTALSLPPHGDARQHIAIRTDGVPPGQYYLSVFPSDPSRGGRLGDGRFHMPVVIER